MSFDLCLLILSIVSLGAAFVIGFSLGRLTAPVVKIDLDDFIKRAADRSKPAPTDNDQLVK